VPSIRVLWLTQPGVAPTGIWRCASPSAATVYRGAPILREKTRAAVRAGKLAARAPTRTWGGPGVGADCAVCGVPVTHGEMEVEIQFARDGGKSGLDQYHLHIRCFAAWEFERSKA